MSRSEVDKLAASAGSGGSGSSPVPTGGLLSGAGSLIHGTSVVLDRAFAMFAPGQGWRLVFGAAALMLAFLSFRAFSGQVTA
jgi:hypothetical protein